MAEPQSESDSGEIDMDSLENRLESLMNDSDDDDDLLTNDQLLHLAKHEPELLTKSQLLTVVRIMKPTTQSSDESDDVSETLTADDAESQSVDGDDRPDAVTQTDTEPQSPDGRQSETQSDDRRSETQQTQY